MPDPTTPTPAATVQVRMLTSMAGHDFSYMPGDIVPVAPEVAEAWTVAGIADEPPEADSLEARVKALEHDLADSEAARQSLEADVVALKAQAETLSAELEAARATIAAMPAPAKA